MTDGRTLLRAGDYELVWREVDYGALTRTYIVAASGIAMATFIAQNTGQRLWLLAFVMVFALICAVLEVVTGDG